MNNLFDFPKANPPQTNFYDLTKLLINMNCSNKAFNHNIMFHIHRIIES